MERTGRQNELADAGLRLVAGEGMGGVTFRAVAAESGWSLGAVQRAFGSKEDLQAAMLERLRTSVEPQVPGEPGRPTLDVWLVELVIAVAPFDDRRRAMQRQGHAFAELAPFDDRIGQVIAEDDDRPVSYTHLDVYKRQQVGRLVVVVVVLVDDDDLPFLGRQSSPQLVGCHGSGGSPAEDHEGSHCWVLM